MSVFGNSSVGSTVRRMAAPNGSPRVNVSCTRPAGGSCFSLLGAMPPSRSGSPAVGHLDARANGPWLYGPWTGWRSDDRDGHAGDLADPGGLRPAQGRARRLDREPPRHRRRDQRPPRRGRPQGERRLPRRPRGAGPAGGPHPAAAGAAAHRAGRHRSHQLRRRLARHGARASPTTATTTTETFLLGSREEGSHGDLQVFSPNSPLGAALLGAHVGEPRKYPLPDGGSMQVTLVSAEPFTG